MRLEGNKKNETIKESKALLNNGTTLKGKIHTAQRGVARRISNVTPIPHKELLQKIDSIVQNIPDSIKVYASKSEVPEYSREERQKLSRLVSLFFNYLPERIQYLCCLFYQSDGFGVLPPLVATECLGDEIRTKKFLQAIKDAVIDKRYNNKEKINVLDAGSGPIPILGLYATLLSDKVHCTCVEYNRISYNAAKQFIEFFKLEDRIKVIQADATQYIPKENIDLLISETMNSGLTNEMIVQIMSNLSQYLSKDSITIPDEIIVKVGLIPAHEYENEEGPHIILSKHDIPTPYMNVNWLNTINYKPGEKLEKINLNIPLDIIDLSKEQDFIVFVSSDVLLGRYKLGDYESAVSTPKFICPKHDSKPYKINLSKVKHLNISYIPGEEICSDNLDWN